MDHGWRHFTSLALFCVFTVTSKKGTHCSHARDGLEIGRFKSTHVDLRVTGRLFMSSLSLKRKNLISKTRKNQFACAKYFYFILLLRISRIVRPKTFEKSLRQKLIKNEKCLILNHERWT